MSFSQNHDLFTAMNHFDPFRKFPSAAPDSAHIDFADEFASLIDRPDPYHRPHNIFDISAPAQVASSASSTASTFPHEPPPGFNSTLPALNSSMRYEPHDAPHPPSSFPSTHFNRHTPSPIHHPTSRSRSRSRPPSSTGGPARTTRTRRNNSLSSTSPPPRPQAILIPGTHSHHRMAASLGGPPSSTPQPWFGINSHSSPSDFSLPTPDSNTIHSHIHHAHSHSHSHSHQGYTPFSLNSPTDMHLPPLSHSQLPPTVPKDSHHLSLSSSIGSNGTIVNGLNGLGLGAGLSPPHTHSSLVSNPPPGLVSQAQSAAEKQAAIANEKRRRRRESHNAVERRRRDNINEKISELATLIPECMLDVAGANTSGGTPILEDQLLSPISPVIESVPGLKKEEDGGIGTPTSTTSPTAAATEAGVVKANKGMILRKSVEYIRYLQQLVTAQGARNRELEQELKSYRGGDPSSSSTTSAVAASPDESLPNNTIITKDEMILASDPHPPTVQQFPLPTTNEDDESSSSLMDMDTYHNHAAAHFTTRESASPTVEDVEESQGGDSPESEERGRTRDRDVVATRGAREVNLGVPGLGLGLPVAMET